MGREEDEEGDDQGDEAEARACSVERSGEPGREWTQRARQENGVTSPIDRHG